jgi:hypothetical protein
MQRDKLMLQEIGMKGKKNGKKKLCIFTHIINVGMKK